jgi:serine-type D-Ala-D-Ala carboxypeptidase/endopeptidase
MTIALSLALLVVVASFAVLYLWYRLSNVVDKFDLEAAIDTQVNRVMRHGRLPGLVVGVYKDGKAFIKGYGTISKDGATAPDANTIFQIASVSKLFTSSVLQAVCDEGHLNIEATLEVLLGSSMPLSPAARQVTLKQLATHTSGFPSIPKSLDAKMTRMAGADDPLLDPYSYFGPEFIFEYLATTVDKRRAGRFQYSNFGMGLLGHVLEVVTEKRFESLVADKLLTPLGMSQTAIALTPEMKGRLAQGYTAKGKPTRIWTFAALAGAGAYSSSAEDMLKFVRASVEDGTPASKLFKSTCQPQFGGDTGIGWMQPTFLDKFFGNGQIVWHNGMVGGYASYLSIDTKTKSGTVVLANASVDVTLVGMLVTRQVRTQSYATKHESIVRSL